MMYFVRETEKGTWIVFNEWAEYGEFITPEQAYKRLDELEASDRFEPNFEVLDELVAEAQRLGLYGDKQ